MKALLLATMVLSNDEVLVGYSIRGKKAGVVSLGMFCNDPEVAIRSLEEASRMNPQVIYMSHGGTITGSEFTTALERLKKNL